MSLISLIVSTILLLFFCWHWYMVVYYEPDSFAVIEYETPAAYFEANPDSFKYLDDDLNWHPNPNQDYAYLDLNGELQYNPFCHNCLTPIADISIFDFANEEGLIDDRAFRDAVINYIHENNLDEYLDANGRRDYIEY